MVEDSLTVNGRSVNQESWKRKTLEENGQTEVHLADPLTHNGQQEICAVPWQAQRRFLKYSWLAYLGILIYESTERSSTFGHP